MNRPIALTCGDPSGVGPEISLKAWDALKDELTFFVIGDPRHFPTDAPIVEITSPDQASDAMAHGMPLLVHEFASPVIAGQANLKNAQNVINVITQAVDTVQKGMASAVCTNPINKQILKEGADFPHPGHTEFLADLGGVQRSVMMLMAPELRVVPVTIHIPLADVPIALTADLLRDTILTTNAALIRDFGLKSPRIAVAGLNPHAGEGGTMGKTEIDMISPLLDELRTQGLAITGPLPADTMFHPKARDTYDVAVCMYHDQALIPIKTINFAAGVNVTLGLPFIRTSPDHGTAFDIAGQGQAEATSLIEALRAARAMAQQRAEHDNI
jgi:4-hydroxythreonine-4-phosphate dehydrogenase